MPLQYISKGTGDNTGTGTNAKTAGEMINANFDYLKSLIDALSIVKIGDFYVKKATGNTDVVNFEVGDTFEGFTASNTRYVKGLVVTLPFDLDDEDSVKLPINIYI